MDFRLNHGEKQGYTLVIDLRDAAHEGRQILTLDLDEDEYIALQAEVHKIEYERKRLSRSEAEKE